jgi:hypothetical protein
MTRKRFYVLAFISPIGKNYFHREEGVMPRLSQIICGDLESAVRFNLADARLNQKYFADQGHEVLIENV